MTRGRKALPGVEKIGPQLGQLTHEAAAEEAAAKAIDMGALEQADSLIQVGRIQVHDFLQKLNRVSAAKEFQKLRQSNGYKGLPYRDQNGNLKRVSDLEEFCEVFFGRTYRSIHDDAQNLNLLGDELYEHALALGLTTRNFREIRSLPQDDQALVKEAIESKSREAVIEILESVIVKHGKEKKQYDKQIKNLEGDLTAARDVAAKRNQKINDLEEQVHKRLKDLPAQLRELQIDCARASGECINGVAMFTQIRLSTMDLLNGNARDRNDDEVLGAIGATHLQLLWQVQAWLTEEMNWSEQVFGGSRVQVRMENERGPALTDDEILNLKNAGADEAARVAGPRVAEEIIARRQERAANKKSKVHEEAP